MQKQEGLNKLGAMPNIIRNTLIAVPSTYLYAGAQENKVRQGQHIGYFQNLIREYPGVASVFGIAGLQKAQKVFKGLSKKAHSKENTIKVINNLSQDKIDQVFTDLVNL